MQLWMKLFSFIFELLLLYKNTINFCILTWYPVILLHLFSCFWFFINYLGLYIGLCHLWIKTVLILFNSDTFPPSFAPARTSSECWKAVVRADILTYLIPILRGKALTSHHYFSFRLFTDALSISLRGCLLFLVCPEILSFIGQCWTLSNFFSTSTEIIMGGG